MSRTICVLLSVFVVSWLICVPEAYSKVRAGSTRHKGTAHAKAGRANLKKVRAKPGKKHAKAGLARRSGKKTGIRTRNAAAGSRKYLVKRGDTLYSIARRCGLKESELVRINRLKGKNIRPGQALRIPSATARVLSARRPPYAEGVQEAAVPAVYRETLSQGAEMYGCEDVVSLAERFQGVPYRFGGNGAGGFDCSGFSKKMFGSFGLDLPRTAREQFTMGDAVERDGLKRGDLVFFRTYAPYASHVGIYIGDGRFIHAATRGDKVEISGLDEPYYTTRYIGARRLLRGAGDDMSNQLEEPEESGT